LYNTSSSVTNVHTQWRSPSTGNDVSSTVFGYGNRYPVRFIRVTDERLKSLEAEYGDVAGFIDAIRE
jgi:hypothetical protein